MLSKLPEKVVVLIVFFITVILAGLFVVIIRPIQEWLPTLPASWAVVVSIIMILGTIGWCWYRSKNFIFQGAIDNKNWRDLRVWATVLLIVMIIIYLIFK